MAKVTHRSPALITIRFPESGLSCLAQETKIEQDPFQRMVTITLLIREIDYHRAWNRQSLSVQAVPQELPSPGHSITDLGQWLDSCSVVERELYRQEYYNLKLYLTSLSEKLGITIIQEKS